MMELLSDKEWFRSPNQYSSPALAWGLGDLAQVNRLGEGSLFFGMESSPSSGSSKRARAPNNGAQVVSCLVDGCISDLSKCRDYHRRHKVCEDHSKTPKVTIGGHEQRFCQQCSRFHSLVEFDEGKRSCRKRLDGHNRRRRKPQPESLAFNSGRFLSSQPATRFMPFSSPEIFPTAVGSSTWDSTLKAQNGSLHYNTHPQLNFIDRKSSFLGSFPHSYGEGKQFPFLQGSDSTLTESSVCQSLPNHVPTLKIGGSSRKLFADGSNSVTNNSDRALSLLSSPPTETREIGLSHIMQPHQTPPAQCLFPRSQYSASGMDGVPISSVLAADGSNSSNMYCQGMFQIEPDESSASASHQTISFSWE